jgi:hypothetical protein
VAKVKKEKKIGVIFYLKIAVCSSLSDSLLADLAFSSSPGKM